MVVAEPIRDLCRFIVPDHDSAKEVPIEATPSIVRSKVDDIVGLVRAESSYEPAKLFRGLRLILGEDEMSVSQFKLVQEYCENPRPEKKATLISSLPLHLHQEQAHTLLSETLIDTLGENTPTEALNKTIPELDLSAETYPFAKYVADCVRQYMMQHPENLGIDISFPDFCRFVPRCRLLPQIHRIEAWLRYLQQPVSYTANSVTANNVTPRLEAVANGVTNLYLTAVRIHQVATHFCPKDNTHSTSIVHCMHTYGLSDDLHSEIPQPAYFGSGPTDAIAMSKANVYQRFAIQGRELDWDVFERDWSTSLSIDGGENTLRQLIIWSPDRMKLLLCVSNHSIAKLNLAPMGKRALNKILLGLSEVVQIIQWMKHEGKTCDHLLDRVAAVKWLMLMSLNGARPEDVHLELPEDISRLLRSHIELVPHEEQDVLSRIVPIMFSIDSPDMVHHVFFTDQLST